MTKWRQRLQEALTHDRPAPRRPGKGYPLVGKHPTQAEIDAAEAIRDAAARQPAVKLDKLQEMDIEIKAAKIRQSIWEG